jgi:hypothetical protein
MAVAVRATSQIFSTTSSSPITIPATVQAGDLLILQAVGAWSPTVPAGWTTEYSNSGSNIGSFVAYKTAAAGDIGAVVTVSWSGAFNNVLNLIAISGGSGLRTPASHLWASSGGAGTPAAQSAAIGDMVVYLGGNRSDGGPPTLSRGTIDVSAADTSTVAAGVIGHELLAADEIVSCTFTAPSNGSGYEYSVLLVSGGNTPPNHRMMSRESVTVLANDQTVTRTLSRASISLVVNDATINRTLSRMGVNVLIKSEPRFRGWGSQS